MADQGLITTVPFGALDRRPLQLLARDRSFVIGDTPHDIRCARTIGVRAVAVATGAYTATQLAAHQAWWVVEGLPSPDEFAARLGLLGSPALDAREAAQ